MLDNVKFTLYEITGYLLPGCLVALAVTAAFWTLFLWPVPFPVYLVESGFPVWIVLALAAYAGGHLAQALGNMLPANPEEDHLSFASQSPVVRAARQSIAQLLQVEEASIPPKTLFAFCDEYAIQQGQPGDREMFVYREGFYRGCTVGLALLSASAMLRLAVPWTALRFLRYTYLVSRWQMLVIVVFLGTSTWLAYRRLKRFGCYRVNRAALAFVCSTIKPAAGSTPGKPQQHLDPGSLDTTRPNEPTRPDVTGSTETYSSRGRSR